MALKVGDRVKQTTTTTGTGTITLNGAAPTGFSLFRDYLSDGDTTYYVIEDGTNYEIGLGTFNTGSSPNDGTSDTIARSSNANVYRSTNSNNRVDWSSGTRSVFISLPSDKAVFEDALGDVTFTGNLSNAVWDKSENTFRVEDNAYLVAGTGNDLYIYHVVVGGANDSFISNQTGDLTIVNNADDKDLILKTDNGSGGNTAYITLDGS